MTEPIRRPLPSGVSFTVTERHQGAPTRIVITVNRENFRRIGFCIAAVVDNLVMTAPRRVVDLISRNPGMIRQIQELVRTAGDEVQITLLLHRQVSRGNRVFAITVLSQHITFDDMPVSPEPSGGLPSHALPELQEVDRGLTQLTTSLIQSALLDIGLGGILGAIVSSVQMAAALIEFRERHIPYAYRRGFWHVVFWEPPQRQNPEDGAFMDGAARAQRQRVVEAYDAGYQDGMRVRERFLTEIWQRIYLSRNRYDRGTVEAIERLNQETHRHARWVALTAALRHDYPWYSDSLVQLIVVPD